jgi:hypothetical protein
MSGERAIQLRGALALPVGVLSLIVGLIDLIIALAFAWMAAAWFLRLYRNAGENALVDGCFQVIATLVISHGLTPDPSWNRPVIMLTAIASSWRVYILPVSAVVLGLLGLLLARRARSGTGKLSAAAAAARFSVIGASLGGIAIATLLGWLVVYWAVWG